MIKLFFLIFITLFLNPLSYGCKYDDISSANRSADRSAFIAKQNNPGLRISWKDMKQKNKDYLIGTVDKVVKSFEKQMCDKIVDAKFKRSNPGIDIHITKTDFKGYYINCLPKDRCRDIDLEGLTKKFSKPRFKPTKEILTEQIFEFTTAKGENYNDGYVKARVKDAYGDKYDPKKSVGEFLDKEIQSAIKTATGLDDLNSEKILDPRFMANLDVQINHFRAGDLDKVDDKIMPLIKALDSMEIPFESSDNFDEALDNAMRSDNDGVSSELKRLKKGERYTIGRAQGGDDMTLVIKDKDGQIVKVVGADAKGLGLLNMTTRFESYIKNFQDKRVETNTTNDLIRVSTEAINVADERMFSSMDAYHEIFEYNLNNSGTDDIDLIIRRSHEDYMALQFLDEQQLEEIDSIKNLKTKYSKKGLMNMRAGAINACGLSKQCVKDRITTIHNTLKLMEKAGIDGHFGDSCIGTEYWARKLGAKELRSLK